MAATTYNPIPYEFEALAPRETVRRGREFFDLMTRRRSVRDFSTEAPPRECVELAIRTAASAPSGAHRQPWKFVIVDDPALKKAIREAAEEEERENYENRFPPEWLEALAALGTSGDKPFLEEAPYLVVVFKESYGVDDAGGKITNYYVNESVGIACGMFIAALHNMGLVTLTHTPSPHGIPVAASEPPAKRKAVYSLSGGVPRRRRHGAGLEAKKL